MDDIGQIIIENGEIRIITKDEMPPAALQAVTVTDLSFYKPGRIVRYGGSIICVVTVIALLLCWIIRYPEVVSTPVRLTSFNAPKEITGRIDGRLMRLFATEGQQVYKGDIIAFLESTADPETVLRLKTQLDSMRQLLHAGRPQAIFSMALEAQADLGELQDSYQAFVQRLLEFKPYQQDGFFAKKQQMLQHDIQLLEKIHDNLEDWSQLEQQDLQLSQEGIKMQDMLFADKVVSPQEYRAEMSKLLAKKMTGPQRRQTILQNENEQNNKRVELMELENTFSQQRIIFEQGLQTLYSQVAEWDQQYVLRTQVAGVIHFSTSFQEKMQVKTGQTICYIDPGNSRFYAEMHISQQSMGKVDTGQQVLLRFPSYPYAEFGSVPGHIEFISDIPTDSGYYARIRLERGLQTSYGKKLPYREGLLAEGRIITKEKRLLQHFISNNWK